MTAIAGVPTLQHVLAACPSGCMIANHAETFQDDSFHRTSTQRGPERDSTEVTTAVAREVAAAVLAYAT